MQVRSRLTQDRADQPVGTGGMISEEHRQDRARVQKIRLQIRVDDFSPPSPLQIPEATQAQRTGNEGKATLGTDKPPGRA